jgi:hypothetical protein
VSFIVHVPTYVFEGLPKGALGRSLLVTFRQLREWGGKNPHVQASPDYTFWRYYPPAVPGWVIDFYVTGFVLVVFRVSAYR